MADHDLQFRIAVKCSTENEANDMHCCFDVPAPARACQHISDHRRKTAIRRLDHGFRRLCRMEIDRDAERFSAPKYWPKEFIIQVAPSVMAVDNRSFEALFTNHLL